jgi:glycosyltransferase involved in cell wall biosynthesis
MMNNPKILVIQVPAYNEEESIPAVLNEIPRSIPGVDNILIQVIDDGSVDNTAEVALANGADYVVRHSSNQGLSRAFMTGITHALKLGADIIVNTDADSQYPGEQIPFIVEPILHGKADMVIGDRQPARNQHFPYYKRVLQVIGSWFVSYLSGNQIKDAASGFRAYSRYAALRLQVFNEFSYTLETIIQSKRENIKIVYVPITTNPAIRPSRLHKGIFNFLYKQGGTIIRAIVLYRPIRTAIIIGSPFILTGLFLIGRFLWVYLSGGSGIARYVQSVSIGGTLLLFGFLIFVVGFLGDAIRTNMRMIQEVLIRLRNTDTKNPEQTYDSSVVLSRKSREK